ncbi:MAG: glycosyltransferase [Odoribacter splanchnicus]
MCNCRENSPLVVIQCLTYNHAPYIRQCLDGFVMQKTTFPFIAIVHDDASTDGTSDIVREYENKYPDIIKGIYQKENQYKTNPQAIGDAIAPWLTSKYLAICEGDDYWTDPLKLQKQVDLLEQTPEIGVVYSRAQCFYQKSKKIKETIGKDYISFENLLHVNVIPTLTVMFRKELQRRYEYEIKPYEKQWKMGDYPMWLWMSKNSKLYFMNEVTGVYRILDESASHAKSIDKYMEFYKSCKEIQYFFIGDSHQPELLNRINEYYNSRMYLLCLEHGYAEIRTYRNYLQNLEPLSLKSRLLKISSNYRICEILLKICLQYTFFRKIYNLLIKNN